MPIYAMKCLECNKQQDIYRSVAEMDRDLPQCCAEPMTRCITAPYVMTDIQPYKSMIDGSMIQSRSQHRTHLKDHGMIELGNEQPVKQKQVEVGKDLKKDLWETVTGLGG